jgi:hypothetical protein
VYVAFSIIKLLVQNKILKCEFLWHGLENTGFSPKTTLILIFLSGYFLKMVKRTNLTVNDCQSLKDFLLERVNNGQLRRGSIAKGAMVSRLWPQWNVAHANALNGEWNVASGKKAN